MKRSEARHLIECTINAFRRFESDTSDKNLINHFMVSLEIIIDKINIKNSTQSSFKVYDDVFEQTGEILNVQTVYIEPIWEPEDD